ncbi:MAG TPA: hypothetical protein VND20_00045 [Candidatus Binataceae bacterium]|nr:hypothetical protein [Candidatus Binataceae bacterium]
MEVVDKYGSYKEQQLRNQLAFLKSSNSISAAAKSGGGIFFGKPRDFVLPDGYGDENLFEPIRKDVINYFENQHVSWHTAAAHLLSSQVCCLNVLAPFVYEPQALKTLLEGILGPIDEMLEIEPKIAPGRFIAFEFTGTKDYLNEWRRGAHTRGANCTSVDAAVRFRTSSGDIEAALIEWKYTETYPRPSDNDSSNKERRRRYENITFHPCGPVRPDPGLKLSDLFAEPIYQLFRQQMLAKQMEKDRDLCLKRVRTVLVAPGGNTAVRVLKISALHEFGGDNVSAWQALLQEPERFIFCTTEELLARVPGVLQETPELKSWSDYIAKRYGFIGDSQNPQQVEVR